MTCGKSIWSLPSFWIVRVWFSFAYDVFKPVSRTYSSCLKGFLHSVESCFCKPGNNRYVFHFWVWAISSHLVSSFVREQDGSLGSLEGLQHPWRWRGHTGNTRAQDAQRLYQIAIILVAWKSMLCSARSLVWIYFHSLWLSMMARGSPFVSF